MDQEVLVVERDKLPVRERFIPWSRAQAYLNDLSPRWMRRTSAEASKAWIQLIPVAVIRNRSRYCVLRRIKQTRRDLQSRVTLVVGGHVDRPDPERQAETLGLLSETVVRELQEEVGLATKVPVTPIGMVIDTSTVGSSRHVAVAYEVRTTSKVRARAPEEFSARSKFSGEFLRPRDLEKLRRAFDPWSSILFEQYIAPSQHQVPMPLLIDE